MRREAHGDVAASCLSCWRAAGATCTVCRHDMSRNNDHASPWAVAAFRRLMVLRASTATVPLRTFRRRCNSARKRRTRICATCDRSHGDALPRCLACRRVAGSMCIACGTTSAQQDMTYTVRCNYCRIGQAAAAARAFLKGESLKWEHQQAARTHTFTGNEAVLQLLTLPVMSDAPLPAYGAHPSYVSPYHCRLCFKA